MVRNAMSATEFYILQYLWTRETPATFSEIMVHFNETERMEETDCKYFPFPFITERIFKY